MLVSLAGLCLLVFGAREAASLRARLTPASLLIGAQSAVEAPDGTLFVGSDLARVHVYTRDGLPVRGFEVPIDRFALRLAPPDRLWLVPETGAPLAFDLEGNPVETGAAASPPPDPAGAALRIRDGDVVEGDAGSTRVRVHGYETHMDMLVHTLAVGLALFSGGALLLGGMVATGRRRSDA